MGNLLVHVGIDDFDSHTGGCTTHLAVKIAWELTGRKAGLVDYPNLVRLNPAVPWKTRGNGAVALRLETERAARDILDMIEVMAEDYAREFDNPKHQPAIVVLEGGIPEYLRRIGTRAAGDLIPLQVVERVIEKSGALAKSVKGRRGLVGATAAIGVDLLEGDFTYEAILYRVRENIGRPRLVDAESVKEAELGSKGALFLNYDHDTGRLLATPRGPDPVLMGIRGESPEPVVTALKSIRVFEEVEAAVLFRTNQHTDMHLQEVESVCEAYPYRCVRVRGIVTRAPQRIQGGHVVFSVSDGHCSIDVAAYEPTKEFRDVVSELVAGDEVEVMGCVRPGSTTHPPTLNLEKLRVVRLAEVYRFENPLCPRCGARMTSAGYGKGFKCPKCGYRTTELGKVKIRIERSIAPGLYQPPKHAFKHLMKPVERFSIPPKKFTYRLVDPFIKPPSGAP
ncbi:TiaS agmantine-binding domain-containing protein [Thermogladius sp.]|uniref:TiaS agmantine-binding domain-containing protein n=1 Tax=Thermogladius sp. TaxID=2023064 RepID=UPI003D12940C